MTKLLPLIILSVVLAGCSSQKEVPKSNPKVLFQNNQDTKTLKKEALSHFIDGSLAEEKGDFASAIVEYQDALRIDPHAGIYYALAKNYLYLNKLPLALQNANKSIELDSNQIDYYGLLSDIYVSARQYDSAAVVLQKIVDLDSTDVNSYYRLARIYEKNRPLKAIEIYNKITSIVGPDWNVLIHVAELYSGLGKFKEAAASVKSLLTIDPSNTGLQKLLSEYYIKAKMYDEALKIVNDIIAEVPGDLDAHERKAQIYIEMGKWSDAATEYSYILQQPKISLDQKIRIGATYFNQSLKDSTLMPVTKKIFETINKDTAYWQAKMYLGAIAMSEKNDSVAINEFKAATHLASWNAEAWVRLGGLYFDNHKYDEAVKVMSEAVKSFPEDFRVNLILGLALSQNGKNSDAKGYLQKAVELDSTDVTALSAYGYTLNQLKENDEAIIYLKKALAISPNDVNLLGTLGLIYDSQEKWNECDSVYQKALSIDSTNALINNNYAYSLSERGIKLDEALGMSKLSIKAEPANSAYLDTMGWIYFKMKNYSEAEEYVQKALTIGGNKPDELEHLGDIEFKLGNKDKAKEIWQKAFDLDKSNIKLKNKIEKGEI
ncbi:MAG: tetratricopeptide repeat protein [Ignavibacteriaceae bacterium]